MSWKTLVVVIVMLGSYPSLVAQDKQSEPFLGIWEINLTKTVNYPQQSQMIRSGSESALRRDCLPS